MSCCSAHASLCTLGAVSLSDLAQNRILNGSSEPDAADVCSVEKLPDFITTSRVSGSSGPDPQLVGPTSPQILRGERSECKGEVTTRNHRWKKIKATLPLILVKSFNHNRAAEGATALVEEDGISDFEELHAPLEVQDKPERVRFPRSRSQGDKSSSKVSTPSPEQHPDDRHSKKRLTLSSLEKERLLDWDVATPGRFSASIEASAQAQKQSGDSSKNPSKSPEPGLSRAEPDSGHPLSGFQQWASILRRSFSKATNNPKVIRRNRPSRARPLSESAFTLSHLFGTSTRAEGEQPMMRPRNATAGSHPRSEITAMLEQVALDTKPEGTFKDDMASLPPRKLNFFSSLRLKRNEGGDRSKADNHVWSILAKYRNKGSSQQRQQQYQADNDSSSEEDQDPGARQSDWRDLTQRRKQQEKSLLVQAKREQLKRLHRAQVIQRQLEEVEEKQRALEERGVALEKALRGETGNQSADDVLLLQNWFKLVLEKNKLGRYESELMIFAKELQLEDQQSRLQQELRRRMAVEDGKKSTADLEQEQGLLSEVMRLVEERDQLVSLLEKQRLQERAEDRDLESLILSKGYQFHWA